MLRAGEIGCCAPPPIGAERAVPAGSRDIALMACVFGLAVLAQTLGAAILPLAALQLGASKAMSVLPFVAMLAGAGFATFPAALLAGGTRAASGLALGAAFGIGGALLAMVALDLSRFELLVLAAFWLGVAQGFGLFHRHLVGASGAGRTHAVGVVIGAGALAGLLAPTLVAESQSLFAPIMFRGAFLMIGLIQGAAAGLALLLRSGIRFAAIQTGRSVAPASAIVWPTLVAMVAWFAMYAGMASAPLSMVGCGLSGAVSGAIAWHAVAMYAAAPAATTLATRIGFARLAPATLVLSGAGLALSFVARSASGFGGALVLLGLAWSLATTGATVFIHKAGLSRFALAMHDGALFAAAIAGALLAGFLV